jgi:uncharacterized membrane protein YcaP (DUF421 family)
MEALFNIDWRSMFVPQESVLAVLVRGTLMYLGMFILLRIFRRQAGSVSIADLLLIVIIADAAQNGMAGEAKSVTEAILLIGVIIFWDYFIDWLGFKSELMSRLVEPKPLMLVKNGRILRRNLESEMITEEELLGQLRQQGVESIDEVKQCCLESGGEFSVIRKDNKDVKPKEGGNKATKRSG